MLLALAATALSIVGTPRWDITVSKTGNLPASHIDVVLKNNTRKPMVWQLARIPPWSVCAFPRPEAGQQFTGSIPPFATATVRIDLIYLPVAYRPGTTYVDEIAFYALGSSEKEVSVPCSMRVNP